ncbi:MAG: ferredoxin-type protein NapF [Pseudomonadota bacterium]
MISRRAFLRGRIRATETEPRPPWAVAEEVFVELCTRCDECIRVCPQKVLERGDGGFPRISFAGGGCDFCGECAQACEAGVLKRDEDSGTRPFPFVVAISDKCLNPKGVVCRACVDECEQRALRYVPRLGGRAEISVNVQNCSGCGACLHKCPVSAIALAYEQTKPVEAD